MKSKWIGFVTVCAVLAAWAAIVHADPPPLTLWATQIGTAEEDIASGIAIDAGGNIYIAGDTEGDLGGPNQGAADAFVAKYNSSGIGQWIGQTGTPQDDYAVAVALDGSGNIYITGDTGGDLGGPNQGSADAFIAKYDSGGTEQWARQIGSSDYDEAFGIALDGSGNIYTAGYTYGDLGGPNQGSCDAFIVACDSGGIVQWARQVGTSAWDEGTGIAVDGSGNIYIAGTTEGDLAGPNQGDADAFILKYDSGGTEQWRRQIGTSSEDEALCIAADAGGNVYVAGYTYGDWGGPNQNYSDAFIVKYDSGGTEQWTRQIGSSGGDEATAVALDAGGNIYIAGETWGDLAGPNQGDCDAFIVKYDSGGTVQWTRQIGSSGVDEAASVALDGSSNCYITGETEGDFGGPNQGYLDAFIMAIGTTLASGGDANVDGCVDGLDYVIWSNNYDTTTGGKAWGHGDSNGDGYVDGLDYVQWSNNYLVGCPATVPEPATLVLLGLGGLLLRRRW